jgi:virginiamycin B lyase
MSLFARFVLVLAAVEAASAQGPNLSFTTYSAPAFSGQVGPYGIIAGSDGALWFQGRFDEIGRITTDGQVTIYPIPHSLWWTPGSITAGPDGAVWFTEFRVNKIARITGGGAVIEYDTPADAGAITTGQDGALWFSEGNKIGRMTTAGVVTEYPLADPKTGAGGIAAGPDARCGSLSRP